MAHRLREVGRADKDHVDILDLQQRVDILDRQVLFELYGDER